MIQSDDTRRVIWHQAVMMRGAAMLPRLRMLSRPELLALCRQAEEHSLAEPLHLMGPTPQYSVPLWSEELLTAAQVVAIMVFGLWILCGESNAVGGALLHDWPEIETALLLAEGSNEEIQEEEAIAS